MTFDNDTFRTTDPTASQIFGYEIHPAWWSRRYEYPWAFGFAEAGMTVADMGCGWMERPFKRMLARLGCQVYAVDNVPPELDNVPQDGIMFVGADISQRIDDIPDHSCDRVFCISVLEDLPDLLDDIMVEFARCMKPDGLMVITADRQYDLNRPTGRYPGIDPDMVFGAADRAGLKYHGQLYKPIPTNAVIHADFNLCVFHYVLRRA